MKEPSLATGGEAASRFRCKQLFRRARERQRRSGRAAWRVGLQPPLSPLCLYPATPGPDRPGEVKQRRCFRSAPPGLARRPPRPPRSPAAASVISLPPLWLRIPRGGAAKGRERRAVGRAPGPRPLPDCRARRAAGGPLSPAEVGSRHGDRSSVTRRAVRGGVSRCACPA